LETLNTRASFVAQTGGKARGTVFFSFRDPRAHPARRRVFLTGKHTAAGPVTR
jgi:hypothetical protein